MFGHYICIFLLNELIKYDTHQEDIKSSVRTEVPFVGHIIFHDVRCYNLVSYFHINKLYLWLLSQSAFGYYKHSVTYNLTNRHFCFYDLESQEKNF